MSRARSIEAAAAVLAASLVAAAPALAAKPVWAGAQKAGTAGKAAKAKKAKARAGRGGGQARRPAPPRAAKSAKPERSVVKQAPPGQARKQAAAPAVAVAPPSAAPAPSLRARSRSGSTSVTRRSAARARPRSTPTVRLGVAAATGATADAAAAPPAEKAPAREPRPAGGAVGPAAETTDRPNIVERTVREIVREVPDSVKAALAAMAALSLLLAAGFLLTTLRRRTLARQRGELLQEVGLLQTALLPPVPEKVGAVRTSVAYRPADGPGAGGDFYDALTLSGRRAAFILGDVSGHGRAALERTAFMRYTLRAYLEAGLSPRAALQVGGRVIDQHLDGDFATVVICVHDPRDGSLTYACAGHPTPIVLGPERHVPVLAASSLPIGLGMRTGIRQTVLPFPPGSVVCLYTDGLAEARTESGILGRPRIEDIVAELGDDGTAATLLDRVEGEARLVTDDMAAILMTPTAGATAGGFRREELEVDAGEAAGELPGVFLAACGVDEIGTQKALERARQVANGYGAAVVRVTFGVRGPNAEVIPHDLAALEVASLAAATER